jgi:hypothetical protein
VLPATLPLKAAAAKVWPPIVVGFQARAYGAVVSVPLSIPSSKNFTLVVLTALSTRTSYGWPRISFAPSKTPIRTPPLYKLNPLIVAGVCVAVGVGVGVGGGVGVGVGDGVGAGLTDTTIESAPESALSLTVSLRV